MNYQRRSLNGLTHYQSNRAFIGYNLFAPLYGKDVWLMDMEGRFVHRWKMPFYWCFSAFQALLTSCG